MKEQQTTLNQKETPEAELKENEAENKKAASAKTKQEVIEKQKKKKEIRRKLLNYCKSYMPKVLIATGLAAVGTFLQILGPNLFGNLANEIQKGLPASGTIDFTAVRNIVLILVIFYAASVLLNFTQGYIMVTVMQRISQKLRTDISRKINQLPLSYFDQVSHGDVLSRVTNDVDVIGQTMSQSIVSLVISLIMFVGTVVMMFHNSWILALIGIGASAFGFIGMVLIAKKSQPHFVRQQEDLGAVNGHIEEIYAGHHVVKVYNGSEEAQQTFEAINERLYESGWKSQFLSGLMMPMMMFIGNFSYVAVCIAGAMLAMNGTISFGVIVAFMLYIRMINQPLAQMAQTLQGFQQAIAAGERTFEFLDAEEMTDESQKSMQLNDVKGHVEFRDVKFGYKPGESVIHHFSATINAGQKVAIVGPTGAGKTTIVNLLMRFYEVDAGDIFIDGTPISCMSRKEVHDQFCMVLQDTWLFEGTIRENIVYCQEGITDEQVKAACQAVGLDHFIGTLPEGYDTLLNDKISLSQGQKQLLTIARAMIQDAPMLILDEATSSVDTRTEHLIQEAMLKLTAGRTSFVIAHRLSTIKHADVILVMKDGDIVESGNHEALLAQNGFYTTLYNSQFEAVA
ncbi:MAG: ABC transporter ATP-binding protein/permease [Defluviitaleaceae bacterium]|nr:ABC transporter ATP-binding protein/permease [Defluviitaleaceae bacterium]